MLVEYCQAASTRPESLKLKEKMDYFSEILTALLLELFEYIFWKG